MLGGLKLLLDGFRLFTDADESPPAGASEGEPRSAGRGLHRAGGAGARRAARAVCAGLDAAEPDLIGELAAEPPEHLYEGLLTVLMRLVFVLYAEDRDLIPSRTDGRRARNLRQRAIPCAAFTRKLLEDAARQSRTRWTSGAAPGAACSRCSA